MAGPLERPSTFSSKYLKSGSLRVAQARQGFPVLLRGVVTYFDTIGPDMFFQDSSGGIWVHWLAGMPSAQKGQLIELEGVTTQADFAPDIAQPRWRVIGEGPMPSSNPPLLRAIGLGGGG